MTIVLLIHVMRMHLFKNIFRIICPSLRDRLGSCDLSICDWQQVQTMFYPVQAKLILVVSLLLIFDNFTLGLGFLSF